MTIPFLLPSNIRIGLVLFGINICQLVDYCLLSIKRDHWSTKALVFLVMFFNFASQMFEVCLDWISSVSDFTYSADVILAVNGMIFTLYSVVVL